MSFARSYCTRSTPFQDMVEGLKDQQNKKKQKKKEIEEAWNIVREKRRAHFEKHGEGNEEAVYVCLQCNRSNYSGY